MCKAQWKNLDHKASLELELLISYIMHDKESHFTRGDQISHIKCIQWLEKFVAVRNTVFNDLFQKTRSIKLILQSLFTTTLPFF